MIGSEALGVTVDSRRSTVAVIIVAYASNSVLGLCVEALMNQTRRPDLVVIIDNNSPDPGYLDDLPRDGTIKVVRNTVNEGFCGANNRGYRLASEHKYILFLNPDAFPQRDLLERAVEWMDQTGNERVGVLTGTLLGFDIMQRRPTGAIDSTGVFQTWYGKWYDRDQGAKWVRPDATPATEDVPAIVGALMFCRATALESVLPPRGEIFDRRFFMYKEDIDLSLRLRRRGWRLVYSPTLLCYHCRGWQGRQKMSTRARYLSARNELRVCFRNNGKGLPYSALKFMFVPLEDGFMRLLKLFGRAG
jgi:N-acetylglucosaminyl-diphospho-decaprenol L-rhamnosyltransferase